VLNSDQLNCTWAPAISGWNKIHDQLKRSSGDRMARRKAKTKPKTARSSADTLAPNRRTAAARRKPGRPPVHDEAWTKVTVVLFNRQIVFLDRLAANIRAQSGAAISRAQLIRALLDAVTDADVDLTAATSENDLKATILARLGNYRLGM
jgi:hypothetical protein